MTPEQRLVSIVGRVERDQASDADWRWLLSLARAAVEHKRTHNPPVVIQGCNCMVCRAVEGSDE